MVVLGQVKCHTVTCNRAYPVQSRVTQYPQSNPRKELIHHRFVLAEHIMWWYLLCLSCGKIHFSDTKIWFDGHAAKGSEQTQRVTSSNDKLRLVYDGRGLSTQHLHHARMRYMLAHVGEPWVYCYVCMRPVVRTKTLVDLLSYAFLFSYFFFSHHSAVTTLWQGINKLYDQFNVKWVTACLFGFIFYFFFHFFFEWHIMIINMTAMRGATGWNVIKR